MRWPTIVVLSALALGLGGCDKIPNIPFLSKKKAATPDSSTMVAAAPKADTTAPAPAPTPARPAATRQAAARALEPTRPDRDTPWTPTDTGTVAPGMTRDQVVSVWGTPVAERTDGNHTYLYYRNGCEWTCGTFDVVFLDDDQVVDAIVRGPGHTYSGISSSPPGRRPGPTLPGGTSGPGGS